MGSYSPRLPQDVDDTIPPTHYEILSVSASLLDAQEQRDVQLQLLKRAYHRALLRYHPDKAASEAAVAASATSGHASRGIGAFTSPSHASSSSPPPPPPPISQKANPSTPLFTIDQITTAYSTLRDPRARKEYDSSLRVASLASSSAARARRDETFQTGVEVVDLDDLECEDDPGAQNQGDGEEPAQRWFRSCRCGNPRGFEFGEDVLEEASEAREFLVGCQDCSLWLKVQFDFEEV